MELRLRSLLLAAVMLAASGVPLDAQYGAIAGRVTNAATLDPVSPATIRVLEGEPRDSVVSESDGSFELRLPAGRYALLVEADGFPPTRFDRVQVRAGLTTAKNLPLESTGYRLAGFIVTASRGAVDTEITAPSSSHAVSSREIEARPATSAVEHLRESPGVDIGTLGVQSSNVVVRGFNNIFSGALHMLTDYRMAGLPALRVNYLHFLPLSDEDMERMEVVLGPGAALYGPNTANGVIHVITKSPLESQGTTASVSAGERSTLQGTFRSAFKVSDDFAVKFSGHLFRANEWRHVDSTELAARTDAEARPDQCVEDRVLRGFTTDEAVTACGRIGDRDFRVRRYGLEARADWRYSPRGTVVGTYGMNDVTGIELTGVGATQSNHWVHQFVQTRFTYDRWAVQGYLNFNNSGDAFQLRDGLPIVDRSKLGVVQIQNGFTLADGRHDVTYGWDYFSTQPETRGTIYGDYEEDNDIREWGVYLHSRTRLTPKVDLIAAGRVDGHSILPAKVFSPRVAVVVQPNDQNALRLAYNRAFATPTALNYFLDLSGGFAPDPLGSLGYSTRAFGSGRNGFSWQNPDGSLRGMRSPFNPGDPGQLLPATQAGLWQLGLGVANEQSPLPPDILAVLQGLSPSSSQVGILYRDTNRWDDGWRPLSTLSLPDVLPVREGITETLEAGWSGVLGNALRVSADVYYMRQHDFVTPLTVETPLLTLDGAGLEAWLGTAYVPARVQDLVDRLGLSTAAATAQATAEAAQLLPGLASGIGQLPLGVVSSDVPEMANGGADLILTYRNVGDLDLWGGDVLVEWLLSREWSVRGTYSHVSRNWFRFDDREPLALNAPANKGTFSATFRDDAGRFDASARVRYTGGFPFLSTDYAGTRCIPDAPSPAFQEDCIEPVALVDLTLGYDLPGSRATLQLGVSNLLDTPYRSFVGAPETGRLAMVRVRYDFF